MSFEELRRSFDEESQPFDQYEQSSEDVLRALAEPEPEPEPEPVQEPEAVEEPVAVAEPEAHAQAIAEHAEAGFSVPGGYATLTGSSSGARRSVGVVVSRFNGEITTQLLSRALETLDAEGVSRDAVTVVPVPGAFELPLAAMALAKTRRFACIVALGCVIRGETAHFDYVAGEAASGLQLAAIETGVPVSFGVLTCDTVEQAEARIDRAADAARGALEMADLFSQLRSSAQAR
jgi:6,7-dimethyl-8-ribityllumazine synthase